MLRISYMHRSYLFFMSHLKSLITFVKRNKKCYHNEIVIEVMLFSSSVPQDIRLMYYYGKNFENASLIEILLLSRKELNMDFNRAL
jgi:hypothetical protein